MQQKTLANKRIIKLHLMELDFIFPLAAAVKNLSVAAPVIEKRTHYIPSLWGYAGGLLLIPDIINSESLLFFKILLLWYNHA